jgi:hypothetical protein
MKEGGDFNCTRHDFKTGSIDKWNEHITKTKHIDITETHCIECGTPFTAEILAQPILKDGSKGISLMCPKCEKKSK